MDYKKKTIEEKVQANDKATKLILKQNNGWNNEWLTWHEKQCEQTSLQTIQPPTNERAWLYLVSDVLTWQNGIGQYLDDPRVQKLAKKLCSEYAQKLYNFPISFNSSSIENNKQKTTDKAEPKFHKGQWIACKGFNTALIIGIVGDKYKVEFFDGNKGFPYIDYVDRLFHLWTIEDAKDGDVLAAHDCFVLFKKIDGLNIKCYCTYHYMNNPSFSIDTLQNKRAFQPATKEQRNLLFTKMKEAGYEWNAEQKELRNK